MRASPRPGRGARCSSSTGRTDPARRLGGSAACVSLGGAAGCATGKALDQPSAVTLSPDGKHAYAAATGSNAVVVMDRDDLTGALTQVAGTAGCVSEDGSAGACADGVGLDEPRALVVSPDGLHVYVLSSASNAIAAFARDAATGALTQLEGTNACISEDGTGGACTDGIALNPLARDQVARKRSRASGRQAPVCGSRHQ